MLLVESCLGRCSRLPRQPSNRIERRAPIKQGLVRNFISQHGEPAEPALKLCARSTWTGRGHLRGRQRSRPLDVGPTQQPLSVGSRRLRTARLRRGTTPGFYIVQRTPLGSSAATAKTKYFRSGGAHRALKRTLGNQDEEVVEALANEEALKQPYLV